MENLCAISCVFLSCPAARDQSSDKGRFGKRQTVGNFVERVARHDIGKVKGICNIPTFGGRIATPRCKKSESP